MAHTGKHNLHCPICLKPITVTIHTPKLDSYKAVVCSNEHGHHVGRIYYRYTNVSEATEKVEKREVPTELIMN